MDTIHFSYNWNNKLDCNIFTTIRIYNKQKHYIGAQFNITWQFEKETIELEPRQIVLLNTFTLDKFTPGMALIDTGYDLPEAKAIIMNMYHKYYPDINKVVFCMLFLKKIKK